MIFIRHEALKNKHNSFKIGRKVYYSTIKEKRILQECYNTLGVTENSDQETIRRAYLSLVKKYHPDSVDGDVKKFQEIDKSFRTIIQYQSKKSWHVDDFIIRSHTVEEFDIKHAAPQHRQYLSHDGFGSGTIFQREKQYGQLRVFQAAENVMQHRIAQVTPDDKSLLHTAPIKTRCGLDRLVEDLIQESMSKGEFSNLSGTGKPLKDVQAVNPYVDFVTHKLNQVLIENGFIPEWIMLQKEIREEIRELKDRLTEERRYLGKYPLETNEDDRWREIIDREVEFLSKINKKIEKYNLLVPMLNNQLVSLNLSKIAEKISIDGKYGDQRKKNVDKEVNDNKEEGIFEFFDVLFKK